MLVDVTPELVEEHLPTAVAGDDGDTKIMPLLVWQAVLGDDLSMYEEVVPGVEWYDSVVGEPTSACLESASGFVDFAGGVTVGVASLANAGVVSPADLAGGVTVGVGGRCWGSVPGRCWGSVPGRPRWQCHHWSGIPGRGWGGVLGRCWGGIPGHCWGGVPGHCLSSFPSRCC